MNNQGAIRRNKLYYEVLERSIAQPIPESSAKKLEAIINDTENDKDYRLVLKLWKEVVAPLDVAIAFIHDNRVLPQEKELVVNEETNAPFMQPDEIYGTLKSLILPTVGEFLSVLPISSGDKKALYDLVEKGDKEGFVSLLEKARCDITPLARLCSHCMDDVMAGLTMTDEERSCALDHLVGALSQNEDDENCRVAAAALQPYIEAKDKEETIESIEQFSEDYFGLLLSQLTADLHYFWNYYDLYTLKERNLIEPLFGHPLAVDLVNQIWEEYKAALDKEPFTLPDDFFDWHHKANTPKEYFYMDDAFKKKGVEAFVAFINWLADKGYIEDDNEVKALFAYRLTGRCRPKGKELPTIEWRGKNNKPYELIYIIKSFSDWADYKKMRRFFTGPEWAKDSDGSYAKSASRHFQRQLAKFYPEACKVLI